MRNSAARVFALAFLSRASAVAQSEPLDLDELDQLGGDLEEVSESAPTMDGTTSIVGRSYPKDRESRTSDSLQYRVDIELRYSSGQFSGLLRPWFVVDAFDTDTLRYEPLEGYVEWTGASVDVRLGQFVESWGMVDTFNPIDVLNRKDIVPEPLEPVSRGELGARARIHHPGGDAFAEPALAAYWIPLWRETPQPGDEHRFSVASIVPGVTTGPARGPDFESGQFFALTFSHQLRTPVVQADLLYVGVRGPSRTPTYAVSENATQLIPEYYGWWMAGLGMRAVPTAEWLSSTTVKTELAYKHSYEIRELTDPLPGDFFQYALGLEYSLSPGLTDHDSWTLMLEYLGEAGPDDLAARLRVYDHDAVLALRWSAGNFSRTRVETVSVVDVEGENLRFGANVRSQLLFLHPDVGLELGGNYLRFKGASNPYAGLPDNSDVYAELFAVF